MAAHSPLVFSGIQPSGDLHLGNYLGAIKNWVPMQAKMPCLFCIVDLHAITVWIEPAELRAKTREVAAAYIACGIDPGRAAIFVQSHVGAHAELSWILSCVARTGWLSRMTQFKDKAGKNSEKASMGLYAYPVLMAADILAYKGTHVPVGEDQKQHLELARDIAQKFNNDYNAPDFFPLVEPLIMGPGARIMSLRDGTQKMSKSDPSELSRINLADDSEAIANKIRKAKTDPEPISGDVAVLEKRPEADNLVSIYAALAGKEKKTIAAEFAGKQFSDFKPRLAELMVAELSPIRERMQRLLGDPAELDRILHKGAARARARAEPVLADVKRIVGFLA